LHIQSLEISGFRGINRSLRFGTDGKSLLLVGENGVGKTSILQGIEWGLLGEVAFLEGDEFKREDALVNLFNENGVAGVKIAIKDEKGASLEMVRERKRLSRTKGRSSIVLNVDGEGYKAKSAEAKLVELLEFSPEEYSTTIHLHQEVIRELVEGGEKARSRAINKILGIDLLSDFGEIVTKQLHSASVVNRSLRAIQKIVEHLSVERKTINDTKVAEERALESTRARLVEKGVNVEKLDQAISSLFSETKQVMDETAKELAIDKLVPRISSLEILIEGADKIEEGLDEIKDVKRELSSVAHKLVSGTQNEIVELDLLKKQHTSYLSQLTELKLKDKAEIDNQMKTVGSELTELDEKLAGLRSKESRLKDLKDDVNRVLNRINESSKEVCSIVENYGDEDAIEQKQRMLIEQENNLKQDLDRLGVYNNLLNLARTYIEATRENICPVCDRPIEYKSILSSIQKKISEKLIKHMEELRQRQQKVKEDKGKLMEALKELKRLKESLEGYKVKLDEAKKQFYEITGFELVEPILSSIESQIGELGKNIEENEQRIEEFNARLNQLKRAQSIIENLALVEKKISDALGVSGSSTELSEALLKNIKSEREELKKLRLIYERVEKLDEKINLLEDIATLFRRSASLNGLNKSLKEIDQKLLIQQEKLQKLHELIDALTDIRDAINSVKMEALEEILSTIRDDLNAIYSRLLGHPFFIQLQLIPEEERGTHIYRIKAQSKDEAYTTYVRTRFSQTQRNLVAISLFLAMAKRSPARLVILDDPSQSLDLEHKKALVEVLHALMEDIQVIVATQDEVFAGQMLKSISSEKLRAYKLSRWSEGGPVLEEIH